MLNRHGLVAGATGTGKTKTLQLMAEQLSAAGVPVVPRRRQGRPVRAGRAGGGRATRSTAAGRPRSATTGRRRRSRSSSSRSAAIGTGVPLRATMTSSARRCCRRCSTSTTTQESSLGLVFHYADKAGLPLLDLKDLRAVIQYLISDEGKAELDEPRRPLDGDRRRDPARADRSRGPGRRRVLRRAGVRHQPTCCARRRTAAASISCVELPAVQDRPQLFSHVPDVAARRPVPRAARGRRPRQAEAGVLLRRGAPAVRRREQGVPRRGHADGAADPVQGRRHLLRHADARRTCPTTCSASSATGCSTRCARSRRTTRRRSRRRCRPSRRPTTTTSTSC